MPTLRLRHGPVTEKIAERFVAATLMASKRLGGPLPSLALKLLRRKLTCAAVENISALPSVDHGAPRSGAGVHLRRLRKSPKNNRRDFADLGHRPRLRDDLPTSATKRGASHGLREMGGAGRAALLSSARQVVNEQQGAVVL